jgi:hypothetical protein
VAKWTGQDFLLSNLIIQGQWETSGCNLAHATHIELIGCSIASKPKYVSLNSISRSASHKAIEYPATSMLLMGLVNLDSFVVAGVTNTYGSG